MLSIFGMSLPLGTCTNAWGCLYGEGGLHSKKAQDWSAWATSTLGVRESFPGGTVLLGVILAPPLRTRFCAEEGEPVARAAEGLDFSEGFPSQGPKASL